jgi:hypothetical protein
VQEPGKLVWSNILMWEEPLQTLAVFLAGLGGYWLLTFAAYGAHTMTLVTGARGLTRSVGAVGDAVSHSGGWFDALDE